MCGPHHRAWTDIAAGVIHETKRSKTNYISASLSPFYC